MKKVVEAIVDNSHDVIPCSAVLDGEYGQHNLSMGVPIVFGSGGVHDIVELELKPEEQTYLKGTLDVLTKAMRQVDDFVKESK